MDERSRRRELILAIIARKRVHNQADLLRELQAEDLELTQSTLSRELKALGIAKAPDPRGGYRYVAGQQVSDGPLARIISFVIRVQRAENLVVIQTPPGSANGVAQGIDEVDWVEVMGTIAGDNTILIICRSNAQAARVEKRLNAIARA